MSDALIEALGRVVADLQREWRREVERIAAEARATVAELRSEVATLKAEARADLQKDLHRVAEHLVASATINHKGHLLLGQRDLGRVVGRDGEASQQLADMGSFPAQLVALKAQIKADRENDLRKLADHLTGSAIIGRNGHLFLAQRDLGRVVGRDGERGKDGFGFEDMDETLAEDGRTLIRRYTRGDESREFRHSFAVPLYRGVYAAGSTYQAGDVVTFGGSSWVAKSETGSKPGDGDTWTLAVKRGRDGKDARS